jgi:Sulphur oxidation protein SoxZ.
MAEIKIRIPDAIRAGESFEVKTLALAPPLASPDDEFDAAGIPVPHYVGLRADLDGTPVLAADFGTGVARNVMFSFFLTVERPADLTLQWRLRDGGTETRKIALAPR